jgi:5-formyltetrahydrofolate cyclo-ligase
LPLRAWRVFRFRRTAASRISRAPRWRPHDIEPWKSATALKVNPDSPQRPLRAEALRRGITIFVPTPRLRGGFKKLDPRRIPPDKIEEAASLSRGDRWSEEVALVEMPGLVVPCGLSQSCRRCGRSGPRCLCRERVRATMCRRR